MARQFKRLVVGELALSSGGYALHELVERYSTSSIMYERITDSVKGSYCVCHGPGEKIYSDEESYEFIPDPSLLVGDVIIADVAEGVLVTEIVDYGFENYIHMTSVVIPDSLIIIGSSAFSGCTSLERAVISNSVTNIGSFVFSGCTSLKEIKFTGTEAQWNSISKASGWSTGCPSLSVICTDGTIPI